MEIAWRPNWGETRQHFVDWWNHEGLLIGVWGTPRGEKQWEVSFDPGPPRSKAHYYTDPVFRAQCNHYSLANCCCPADTFPRASTDIGPGSLALVLGSAPGFSDRTVWFEPCIDPDNPEAHPPLTFDPSNPWWRIHEQTLRECVRLGRGKYFTACPDLVENIDILAALRGPQHLLYDLVERPEWVEQKVAEINQAWFETYGRIYDIIKHDDGSAAFGAFQIWGPGTTAKVQCDASAMFSPDMFERFVVPALTQQCDWLDYSMFHLDGSQCIPHLDLLLSIPSLDAIEWTPDPQVPTGGNPHWYPMYRKILEAGKSIQAVGVEPSEVEPLLDAVGPKGVYLLLKCWDIDELERLAVVADRYRAG